MTLLDFRDLVPLPGLDLRLDQIVADGAGVCVVTGPDSLLPGTTSTTSGFPPSGRTTILRVLMRRILAQRPTAQAVVVTNSKDMVRLPRPLRARVQVWVSEPAQILKELVNQAVARRPDLLVLDDLTPETVIPVLEAGQSGLRVLVQLGSIYRGPEILRHLEELGVPRRLLSTVHWVLAVQRFPALCNACKEPAPVQPAIVAELLARGLPAEAVTAVPGFFRARGCDFCGHTGRSSEVTAVDILNADPAAGHKAAQWSRFSLESCLLELAVAGYVAIEDLIDLEANRLRLTYAQLTATERALADALHSLRRREAELEATGRVLQQQTSALIALEGIGQALSSTTTLHELAAHLCRRARDLCGADRSLIYYLAPDSRSAEILAACGWDASLVGQAVEAAPVLAALRGDGPQPYNRWPPGLVRRPTDLTAEALRAGLCVPLVAQHSGVGLMVIHTSSKPHFQPGEVALLQNFANQAAVAIQRAGLVEALQEKVAQLEAAQAELVQKERLERELELARQVQQGVLPHSFPEIAGYQFAAHSLPARQVGGDFYDVIPLCESQHGLGRPISFLLVIGDASDKGMPAALYMALTRSLILAETRHLTAGPTRSELSPRTLLINVHRLLLELGQPSMFVTAFVGLVDGPSGRMTYACAGQDRPILLHENGTQLLHGEGTVLGFPGMEELYLSEEQVALTPGDRLALYTDGLTDTMGPEGQRFGVNRLRSLLSVHRDLPVEEVCSCVFGELAAYRRSAAQYDDMTLLVMDVA